MGVAYRVRSAAHDPIVWRGPGELHYPVDPACVHAGGVLFAVERRPVRGVCQLTLARMAPVAAGVCGADAGACLAPRDVGVDQRVRRRLVGPPRRCAVCVFGE